MTKKKKKAAKPVKQIKNKKPGNRRAFFKSKRKSDIVRSGRKQIYFVNFPKGEKTNAEIEERISEFDLTKQLRNKLPDNLMKVTVVAEKSKKERQSYTNIYRMDLDSEKPKDINTVVKEIWKTITTRPPKNGKDYMKRINKLRGYVKTVIIDFETAGNERTPRRKKFQKRKK